MRKWERKTEREFMSERRYKEESEKERECVCERRYEEESGERERDGYKRERE